MTLDGLVKARLRSASIRYCLDGVLDLIARRRMGYDACFFEDEIADGIATNVFVCLRCGRTGSVDLDDDMDPRYCPACGFKWRKIVGRRFP